MWPEPIMDSGALRAAVQSLTARSAYYGQPYDSGFAITGAARDDDGRYGQLEIVTPGERMPLTSALVERTYGRSLLWAGVWEVSLFVPTECERGGADTPLPAVDYKLETSSRVGSHVIWGQLPWHIAREYPWAVLTVGPIQGWPR